MAPRIRAAIKKAAEADIRSGILVLTLYDEGRQWKAIAVDPKDATNQREVSDDFVCREVSMDFGDLDGRYAGVFFGRQMTLDEEVQHRIEQAKRESGVFTNDEGAKDGTPILWRGPGRDPEA